MGSRGGQRTGAGPGAEVARGALRIVAAGAAGLAPEQVIRVLLEMARAGMAREADSLAAVLSAPAARKAPQVASPTPPAAPGAPTACACCHHGPATSAADGGADREVECAQVVALAAAIAQDPQTVQATLQASGDLPLPSPR